MEIKPGNIARTPATSAPDLAQPPMTKAQFAREKCYLAAMHAARTMLEQGVIDEADFQAIAAFMARKFHPIFGDFFAEKPSFHSVSQ